MSLTDRRDLVKTSFDKHGLNVCLYQKAMHQDQQIHAWRRLKQISLRFLTLQIIFKFLVKQIDFSSFQAQNAVKRRALDDYLLNTRLFIHPSICSISWLYIHNHFSKSVLLKILILHIPNHHKLPENKLCPNKWEGGRYWNLPLRS